MAQLSRDELISKIQKLSRLTIASGATEAEAALAAEKIAQLMHDHGIAETELNVRHEAKQCHSEAYFEFGTRSQEWVYCARSIAFAFDTIAWCLNEHDQETGFDMTGVKFFGLPADVAASTSLLAIVANAMSIESEKFMQTAGKGHGRSAAYAFRRGMASRLSARIRELKITPKGTALVVLKNQLVREEFAKLGIRISTSQAASVKDASAFAAGQSAGSKVDLGSRKLGATLMLSSK